MKTKLLPRVTITALALAASAFTVHACGLNWAWTLDDALKEAQRDDKLVLLFFTGSDWFPRSIPLDKQVFEKGEFSDLAASKFALHLADFPQRTKLSANFEKANMALAERFGIRHFPTVVALKPDGTEYARHRYTDETAADMAGWLTWWEDGFRKDLAAASSKKQPVAP